MENRKKGFIEKSLVWLRQFSVFSFRFENKVCERQGGELFVASWNEGGMEIFVSKTFINKREKKLSSLNAKKKVSLFVRQLFLNSEGQGGKRSER